MLIVQETVDTLINCVGKNLGYSQGKPVAAATIYKCLLNWKSFEAEKTSVFDRLIQLIGSSIEVFSLLISQLIQYNYCGFFLVVLYSIIHPITN